MEVEGDWMLVKKEATMVKSKELRAGGEEEGVDRRIGRGGEEGEGGAQVSEGVGHMEEGSPPSPEEEGEEEEEGEAEGGEADESHQGPHRPMGVPQSPQCARGRWAVTRVMEGGGRGEELPQPTPGGALLTVLVVRV